MKEGKEIAARNRQRKLYCNTPSQNWSVYMKNKWSHVVFEHPANFGTLAMEVKKKEEIMKDLVKFSKGKEYYSTIGKAWKRGYLLYGPPGTGKSTMIAAMANFLNYDVYDLELTAVKDNTELRRLLIETSNKSIIVIEDIDCSLDLTGQRSKKGEDSEDEDEEGADPGKTLKKKAKKEKKEKDSKVTLSGLLNFIDGLWSACGEERIIIFTTNYVDKLDPALIRRGRMDKHIEMSYCGFEAFKLLAKNYLDVDSHMLFEEVSGLLGEIRISPADVAENLMPKSEKDDADVCLKNLIDALKGLKEEAIKKAKEEVRLKAEKEKERRLKAEKEDGKEEEAKLKAEKEAKEKEEARLKAEKEEKEKEEARLKAEEEEKEKEEARLKAEKEEKEKEEARLKVEKEKEERLKVEKEKEEALLKVEKEGKENEDALLKALSVELKAKNNLLKRLLKKMKDHRKK